MSARIPVGQQQWEGFHLMSKPVEMAEIDRRLFGLLLIFFLVFWQGLGLFFLGVVATLALCRVGGGAPRGRWPPSAAQTVRAVFPHTAFTKTLAHGRDRWKESDRQG